MEIDASRRASDLSGRRRTRTARLGAAIAAATILAACGSDGGSTAAGGRSVPTGDCAGLAAVLIEPMDASWRDDSDDADGQEIEADEVRSIVAALPEDHRGAFERFADVIEEIDTDPTKMPSDEDLELVDEVTAAVDELAPWAAEECGHDGPLWACLERSAFEPIGYAISDGPPPTLPDGQPVPSHLTMGDPDGILGEDWDLEIHRSDLVVAVAKVDDDGRVTSRQTVESSADHPGAWTQPTTTSCYDDDEMKFEPIPMPVGDEGDDQGYGFEDGGEQGIDYIGDSVADSTDDGG